MIRRACVASGICARCRMRRESLIRPTVQACRHDRRASVASGIGAWCRMRHATHPTIPYSSIAWPDLIQRRRIINGRQIPGSRPSQIAWIVWRSIFPDRVFGECARQTNVRRAAKVADLAVHQRHNRLLLRMRHITIFQTVALFRNDKRHRYLPFQRIFHPNHRHFGNARMTGDTLFNLARPSRCPATLITSSVRPRIK